MLPSERDPLTEAIIGCAIEVHRCLGPGLRESLYEEALCTELVAAHLRIERQLRVPVLYKGKLIGEHKPDLVVESKVVVEVKCVERLNAVHDAQTLTYMRLLKVRIGLLMNFNEAVLKNGIRRLIL